MTNPYPKPRWDLENDVLRLEQMIILYEQEIAELTTEKEQLKEEVTILRRRLEYYKTIVEVDEEEEWVGTVKINQSFFILKSWRKQKFIFYVSTELNLIILNILSQKKHAHHDDTKS